MPLFYKTFVNYCIKKFYDIRPRLERLTRDKHSSLVQNMWITDLKSFIGFGPGWPWLLGILSMPTTSTAAASTTSTRGWTRAQSGRASSASLYPEAERQLLHDSSPKNGWTRGWNWGRSLPEFWRQKDERSPSKWQRLWRQLLRN